MKRLICALVMLQGCVSNPNKVQYVDTNMDRKGQVNGQMIGLNDKQEVVVQEETHADVELRQMEDEILTLNDQISGLVRRHYMCRKDLADRRLGGSGELPAERDFEVGATLEKYQEEVGLDGSGNLKIVKKSYYLEKRAASKRLVEKLTSLKKSLNRQCESCTWEMTEAWRRVGLPSTWDRVNSLDEAFAMRGKRGDL